LDPYLTVGSSAFYPNEKECQKMFPLLFKNLTTNRRGGKGRGERADFMFYNRHFVKLGQPYASVDFNPTSHLPLTPVRGLKNLGSEWRERGSGPTHIHIIVIFWGCYL
jgi:hypothetical protein